jgi:hypothetical protein
VKNAVKNPPVLALSGEKLENRNWRLETGAATFQFSLYRMKSESENWGGQFPVSAFWFLSLVAHPVESEGLTHFH